METVGCNKAKDRVGVDNASDLGLPYYAMYRVECWQKTPVVKMQMRDEQSAESTKAGTPEASHS